MFYRLLNLRGKHTAALNTATLCMFKFRTQKKKKYMNKSVSDSATFLMYFKFYYKRRHLKHIGTKREKKSDKINHN